MREFITVLLIISASLHASLALVVEQPKKPVSVFFAVFAGLSAVVWRTL